MVLIFHTCTAPREMGTVVFKSGQISTKMLELSSWSGNSRVASIYLFGTSINHNSHCMFLLVCLFVNYLFVCFSPIFSSFFSPVRRRDALNEEKSWCFFSRFGANYPSLADHRSWRKKPHRFGNKNASISCGFMRVYTMTSLSLVSVICCTMYLCFPHVVYRPWWFM